MSDNINSLQAGQIDDKPEMLPADNLMVTGKKKRLLLASLFTNFFVLLGKVRTSP